MQHVNVVTKLAGVALSAIIVGSLTAGTADAATISSRTTGVAAEQRLLVMVAGLDWDASRDVPAFSCPAQAPFLDGTTPATTRSPVPQGVDVEQSGDGIVVTITGATTTRVGDEEFVSGWDAQPGGVHNWAPTYGNVAVYASCTSDVASAYQR